MSNISEVCVLPDGSGFATGNFPLPKEHWSTINPHEFNIPPMSFRMGTKNPDRKKWETMLREAGKYAFRAATLNGKDLDLDPDALIQNLIVGFLGFHTDDGLSSDEWQNPVNIPKEQ